MGGVQGWTGISGRDGHMHMNPKIRRHQPLASAKGLVAGMGASCKGSHEPKHNPFPSGGRSR